MSILSTKLLSYVRTRSENSQMESIYCPHIGLGISSPIFCTQETNRSIVTEEVTNFSTSPNLKESFSKLSDQEDSNSETHNKNTQCLSLILQDEEEANLFALDNEAINNEVNNDQTNFSEAMVIENMPLLDKMSKKSPEVHSGDGDSSKTTSTNDNENIFNNKCEQNEILEKSFEKFRKSKKRKELCGENNCGFSSSLWKCMGMDCGKILCGSAGSNHAENHYKDFPEHVLQQNVKSRRFWCNFCKREVFEGVKNRRLCPGIWFPSNSQLVNDVPPRGLFNIGNTCFMNAALQNIISVPALTSYFMGDVFYDDESKSRRVTTSYSWLLEEFCGHESGSYVRSIVPSRLLYAVRQAHPIFRGFQQHDSQEFLRLFMDSLADETKVPHFYFENQSEVPAKNEKNDSSENESDTESFETADSGNGSEEQIKVDYSSEEGCEIDNSPKIKIVMKSVLDDIFDGEIDSSVQCLFCHETSRRVEVFQDLSLPIPTRDELYALQQNSKLENGEMDDVGWGMWFYEWVKSFIWGPSPTLDECLASFFSSDELKGKNMYSCEKCGKLRNGVKRCYLFHLPQVLCIHLKRFRMFDFPSGMGYSGKISQYVQFPLDGLDVRPFLHKDCKDKVSTYQLSGIICHQGSVTGGHYVAYVRKKENWYLADDCRVTLVDEDHVLSCEAYVLFYQKCDYSGEAEEDKTEVLREWSEFERDNLNCEERGSYELISRKWLTTYLWGEELSEMDNSDVVCPHGLLVPAEKLEMSSTWIPKSVFSLILSKHGGDGRSVKDLTICQECSISYKKWKRVNSGKGGGSSSRFSSNYLNNSVSGGGGGDVDSLISSCIKNLNSSNCSNSSSSSTPPKLYDPI